MTEPKKTVIVATEHESVVRFYAGHVGNGGINQTGQFTTTRAIDPTDLANMAVDLSSTFGWLQVQPPAPPRAVIKLAPTAPKALGKPRTTGSGDTHRSNGQLWRQLVWCPMPGCDHTARRSNMTTHLQGKKHAVPRDRANRMAKEARRVENVPTPAPVKVTSSKPRGAQGAARLVSEVYPRIVDVLRSRGPLNTREIADAINEDRPNTRKHMQRAEAHGLVRKVTPPGTAGNEPNVWAVAD